MFLQKRNKTKQNDEEKKKQSPPEGVEPQAFGMYGQGDIHRATTANDTL